MWFFSRRTRSSSRRSLPRARCRLQVETLEDRCLLAAVIGSVYTDITSGADTAYALGAQSSGQIVGGGTANQSGNGAGTGVFAVARYNADLSLDTGFGNQGIRTTAITASRENDATAMAIYPSIATDLADLDKIVLAGWTNSGTNAASKDNFAVARYTASGALDTTFGGTGSVVTDVGKNHNDFAEAVAIDASGNIVVAGYANTDSRNTAVNAIAVARYTRTGALDKTFNSGGALPGTILSSPVAGGFNRASSVVIQADGKIVVGGYDQTSHAIILERFNSNGTLDASFGSGGIVVAPTLGGGVSLNALAIDTTGRIIAVGQGAATTNTGFGYRPALVARFNANGSLDSTFGNGQGFVLTDISGVNNDSAAQAVKIQSDGKLLVGGWDSDANTFQNFAAVRYNADGSLDTTFNGTGILTYAFPSTTGNLTNQLAYGVGLTATGNIVLAGQTNAPIGTNPNTGVNGTPNFGVVLIDPNAAAPATVSTASQVAVGSLVQATGLDNSTMASVAIRSADLGGATLGLASGQSMWIDDSAAAEDRLGDPTPTTERALTLSGNQGDKHALGIALRMEAAARDRVFADADSAPFQEAVWIGPTSDWI